MKLVERTRGEVAIIDVHGPMVRDEAEPVVLLAALRAALERGHSCILLNVAEVSSVDSLWLGAVVQGYTTAVRRGGTIKLVRVSKRFRELHTGFIDMLQRILDRGVESGDFRSGVDARQLHLTLAAVGYYYLTNRHTGEVIFGFDFLSKEALQARLEFNIDTVLSVLRPR